MGRPVVKFTLSNFSDILAVEEGRLTADRVRQVEMSGVVDTGATNLVLPLNVVQLLGLPFDEKVSVTYGDRRQEIRDTVRLAHVRLCNRANVFNAMVEPSREDALIGAIVMESLDLIVDCRNLSVHPRNPNFIVTEVE